MNILITHLNIQTRSVEAMSNVIQLSLHRRLQQDNRVIAATDAELARLQDELLSMLEDLKKLNATKLSANCREVHFTKLAHVKLSLAVLDPRTREAHLQHIQRGGPDLDSNGLMELARAVCPEYFVINMV